MNRARSLRAEGPSSLDVPLLLLALLLSAFGIAMVYSAGQTDVAVSYVQTAWQRQLAWLAVGFLAAAVIVRVPMRVVLNASGMIYGISVALLGITLVFGSGAGTAASMKGWLTIGGVRLGQPSELAKIAVVLMLARVLADLRTTPRSLVELWRPLLVVAVPWLLIMAQPDLGTGIVFVGIAFAMLFWAGVPWPLLVMVASPAISLVFAFSTQLWAAWMLGVLGLIAWYDVPLRERIAVGAVNLAAGVVAPLVWNNMPEYQQRRLLVFLDPMYDARNAGYQVLQSLSAIGSGGLLGKGFTLGSQKRLGFLPAHHTDFIFAVVGEELGFLGVAVALGLFLALFVRCIRAATRGSDPFAGLVALGIAAGWLVHVVVNIGMTLNLMPITGIPLPFFSYGGSFLLASWLSVALLLRISSEGRGRADGLYF